MSEVNFCQRVRLTVREREMSEPNKITAAVTYPATPSPSVASEEKQLRLI